MADLEITVRTNGDEVIEALEDQGYIVIAPHEPPPLTPQNVWGLTEEAARQSPPYGGNRIAEAWREGRDAAVDYMRDALAARPAPTSKEERDA